MKTASTVRLSRSAGSKPWVGGLLMLAALAAGWFAYGALGLLLALSVIVFWLLLQFSRTMRLMRTLSSRPLGLIDSAVMLQVRIPAGLTMMQTVALTRSLGIRLPYASPGADESWEWKDAGGDALVVDFVGGQTIRAHTVRTSAAETVDARPKIEN